VLEGLFLAVFRLLHQAATGQKQTMGMPLIRQ